jgi:uncharacterized protein (DUF111 family)
MKVGHILAPDGIGREALLGAAIGAGAASEPIAEIVRRLGCRIHVTRPHVGGLTTTHAVIESDPSTNRVDTRARLDAALDEARLDGTDRQAVLDTYARLFTAEAETHGCEPDAVRLHQLGQPQYPALIAATLRAFRDLALDRITVGPIVLGSGTVTTAGHGTLPIPAPATSHLLGGYHVVGGTCPGSGPDPPALCSCRRSPIPIPPFRRCVSSAPLAAPRSAAALRAM